MKQTPMQRVKRFLITTLSTWAFAAGAVSSANAAAVEIYGSMRWNQWGSSYYYDSVYQTGRLADSGSSWYKFGDMSVGYIHNRSYSGRSGSLSMEFWAMPYYGASSGYVKMTRSVAPLYAGYYRYDYYRSGWMRYTGQWRYPEFNLFEYTYYGWKWRDDFLFYNAAYL